jgi:hypothetical protein
MTGFLGTDQPEISKGDFTFRANSIPVFMADLRQRCASIIRHQLRLVLKIWSQIA